MNLLIAVYLKALHFNVLFTSTFKFLMSIDVRMSQPGTGYRLIWRDFGLWERTHNIFLPATLNDVVDAVLHKDCQSIDFVDASSSFRSSDTSRLGIS
jgi:hypothetical protein